jgi:hypothetical protein
MRQAERAAAQEAAADRNARRLPSRIYVGHERRKIVPPGVIDPEIITRSREPTPRSMQ